MRCGSRLQCPLSRVRLSKPFCTYFGAAGCAEDLQKFDDGPLGNWSAVRRAAYGYGYLDVMNNSHARWQQIDVMHNNEVIDEIWVVRDEM